MATDRLDFWIWRQADELFDYAERIQTSFTRAFIGALPEPDGIKSRSQPINVVECADAVWIISALPGVDVDDLEIRLEGDELIISAQRHVPDCCMEGELRVWEIPFGHFERRLRFFGEHRLIMGETRLDRGLLFIQLVRKK